jgi:hypothetical protein
MKTIDATFGLERWDEHTTFEGSDGRKVTRATVEKRYQGGLEGSGTMEYVMAYAPDGSATFVGLERVDGRLDGHEGTFILEDHGTFRDGVASSTFRIVPGSGTDALAGLSGSATVDAVHADTQAMTISFERS